MENIIRKIESIAADETINARDKMDFAVAQLYLGQESCFALIEQLTPLFLKIIEQGVQEGYFSCDYSAEYAELFLVSLLYLNWTPEKRKEKAKAVASAMEMILETELGAFDCVVKKFELLAAS